MSDLDEILVNLSIHKHHRMKRSSTCVQPCFKQYYLILQDHKNTWVLYGCNYPTARINYGWKLDVLWSRQEIDGISDNSIHKKNPKPTVC